MKKILIVDDDTDIRLLLNRFLSQKGYEVYEAGERKSGLKQFHAVKPDLVITDFKLPDGDGMQLSKELIELSPQFPIIMITAYSDVKTAVRAVKKGIFDYITKPLHPDELLETIQRAFKSREENQNPAVDVPQLNSKSEKEYITGQSDAALKVKEEIDIVAPTNFSVIILGETGSGKEYAARELHIKSQRKDKKFVALDCGALSEEIAGSELFGHVKGAFTGAIKDKVGSFEHANGGTLFLDEIGNLTMQNQIKLLRVLQESKVKKIGSNKEVTIDVRVIVATNEDLQDKIQQGEFREDLWFRLNEYCLRLPPLRERKEDIEIFAHHFVAKANESLGKNVTSISPEVIDYFKEYPWNGNLRELKNVMKRAVLLSKQEFITPDVLPAEIKMPSSYFLKKTVEQNDLKGAALNAEQEMILEALKKTGNNKSKAAELLNIDRKTLYNKLKQFQIS